MKVILMFALLTGVAHAQQSSVYGPDGKSLGTVTRDSAGNERFRDAGGRSLGTSSTSSEGTTTIYDERGRVIGRKTK